MRLRLSSGFVGMLLAVALIGCTLQEAPPSTAVRTATPNGAGSVIPTPYDRPPGDALQGTVVRVVDGDTVDVRLDGREERLRLIGIDTPETVDPRSPVQCFGREASDRAKALLPPGTTVQVERDPSQGERDQYDRLFAYLWLPSGAMFNLGMIAEGYAHEFTYRLPYKYRDQFKGAERYARDNNLGLWSPTTCGGNTAQPAASGTSQPAPSGTGTPPRQPAAKSTVSGAVTIVSMMSPAPLGADAGLTARAGPNASCAISYTTPSGTLSTAQGLEPRRADATGRVTWSWTISASTRPGTGTVEVTCDGRTATASIVIG